MRRIFVALCALAVVGPLAAADVQPQERGLVLVVNLWEAAVDVQMGDEVLFSLSGLEPGTPSRLVEVPHQGSFTLYFKPSAETAWRYFAGPEGKPESVPVFPYSLTIVRIDRWGTVEVLRTARPMAAGAKVAFLNGGDRIVDTVSLTDASSDVIARGLGLRSSAVTGFFAVYPGVYRGVDDGGEGSFTEFPDEGWFLVAGGAAGAGPVIWDLAPLSLKD